MECRLTLRQLAMMAVAIWGGGYCCYLLASSHEAVERAFNRTFSSPVADLRPLLELLSHMSGVATTMLVVAGLSASLLLAPWSVAVLFAEWWRVRKLGGPPAIDSGSAWVRS